MYNLMIVEAPPKAKKIESILKEAGLNYKVVATAGYIKDLPKNEYALNFNEKDKVNVDVWQSQQTALRGLMNTVAQQISARDPAKLSKITKDNIVDELKTTEEKIALCR